MPKVSAEYRRAQRQAILDAAVRCFGRDGIHRTSMQAIFAEAGMSAGAVYTYFDSKAEIISAIAEERRRGEAALIDAAFVPGRSPLAASRQLMKDLLTWVAEPSERAVRSVGIQLWAEALRDQELRSIVLRGADQRRVVVQAIEAAQSRGQLARTVDAEMTSRLLLAVVQGVLIQQAWEPDLDVPRLARSIDHAVACLFEPQRRGADY